MGNSWDGYFKAPATGEYKFYISCDDACQLNFDSTNPLSSNLPFTPSTIAQRWWAGDWRDYFDPPSIDDDNQYISDWIMLTQDEYYKIDAYHTQGSGSAHFTVSVEFKSGGSPGHPMATKETQVFTIDQDNVAETWEVIITDPSDGEYRLAF